MARLLREPALERSSIAIPMPGGWDAAAVAAYEQGRAEGYATGRADGYSEGFGVARTEVDRIAERVVLAATHCHDTTRVLHADLLDKLIDLADLYVRTVVRHVPDASARGMLERIEAAIANLEPSELEVAVEPLAVADLTRIFAETETPMRVTVVAAEGLQPGEYRMRTEWATVDGTWDRYLEAAREAMTMFLAEHPL